MRAQVGWAVKNVSDHMHKELSPEEVLDIFRAEFVNIKTPVRPVETHFKQPGNDIISAEVTVEYNGTTAVVSAFGNGRVDAVSRALCGYLGVTIDNLTYNEHALTRGSDSEAVCYVSVDVGGSTYWGVGVHSDIITASLRALVGALNRSLTDKK